MPGFANWVRHLLGETPSPIPTFPRDSHVDSRLTPTTSREVGGLLDQLPAVTPEELPFLRFDAEAQELFVTLVHRERASAASVAASADSRSCRRGSTRQFPRAPRHGQLLRISNIPRGLARTGRIIPHAGAMRLSASSRSFTFWILPELVIGKSSTKMTWRGILKLAILPLHCASTSASVSP